MGVWYSDLSRAARRSTQEHPQKEVSRAAKDALQVRSEKSGGSALLSTQFCLHFRGQLRHKLCVVRTSRQKTYRIVEYLLSRDWACPALTDTFIMLPEPPESRSGLAVLLRKPPA